jgi:enoyl-CoA hydratase
VFEQPAFTIDACGKTGEQSFVANHAMTGRDDGNWILVRGLADGAEGFGFADQFCDVAIRFGVAGLDLTKLSPHLSLKRRPLGVESQIGKGRKIFVEVGFESVQEEIGLNVVFGAKTFAYFCYGFRPRCQETQCTESFLQADSQERSHWGLDRRNLKTHDVFGYSCRHLRLVYMRPSCEELQSGFKIWRDAAMASRNMSELLSYEVSNKIAVLTLSAPPANTYSYEMMQQLDAAILKARMDSEVHVIVLIGAGEKFFCAGADISMLKDADPNFKYYFCLHANETLNRLENTPKLVIAAINGHCVGGGFEVAMAADIRISKAGKHKLGLPEVHLGVLPGTGGTQRFARLVGRAKAIEIMVTGNNFGVEEAKSMGLVSEILDAENFREAALEYAAQFVPPGRASKSVGMIKRAVISGLDVGFSEGLALERELQQQLFTSADAKEGIAAYIEKRSPEFTGS